MLRKLNQYLQKKTLTVILFVIAIAVLGGGAVSETTVSSAQPWSHLKMNNEPNNFQFAIVSDRTGEHREGVFEDAIDRLNLLQPEFVNSCSVLNPPHKIYC